LASCPEGPFRPIDVFALSPGQIAFEAIPSLQHPIRAYVARISSAGPWEPQPKIEVVQLLRGDGCTQWSAEKRWEAPLAANEHAEAVQVALAMMNSRHPASASFRSAWPDDRAPVDGASVRQQPPPAPPTDGTGIRLRLRGGNWEVSRDENSGTADGATISAIFYPLVVKYVPAADVPTANWRTVAN
jgi:hypothetical protein